MDDLSKIRQEYQLKGRSKDIINKHPVNQFTNWLNEDIIGNVNEPTATTLSTSTKEGRLTSRIVLLKGIENQGLHFFSNYNSKNGFQINENPFVSLLFFWSELERQVRIEGSASKLSIDISNNYFESRPLGSKLGAWASLQSKTIPSRKYLDKLHEKFTNEFGK